MSECHRTKSLLKGIMIVFKTKGPQIRCIPHGSFHYELKTDENPVN